MGTLHRSAASALARRFIAIISSLALLALASHASAECIDATFESTPRIEAVLTDPVFNQPVEGTPIELPANIEAVEPGNTCATPGFTPVMVGGSPPWICYQCTDPTADFILPEQICRSCPSGYFHDATRNKCFEECMGDDVYDVALGECAQCPVNHIYDGIRMECVADEGPDYFYISATLEWIKTPADLTGWSFDEQKIGWWHCDPEFFYVPGECKCCRIVTTCGNDGELAPLTRVEIEAGVQIRITSSVGFAEISLDSGQTWGNPDPLQEYDGPLILRTWMSGACSFERVEPTESTESASSDPDYDYAAYEVVYGQFDLIQHGVCAADFGRCGAKTSYATAYMEHDFPSGTHVALETTVNPDGSFVVFSNGGGSQASVRAHATDGPDQGPERVLAAGEAVSYNETRPVPVLSEKGAIALVLAELASALIVLSLLKKRAARKR